MEAERPQIQLRPGTNRCGGSRKSGRALVGSRRASATCGADYRFASRLQPSRQHSVVAETVVADLVRRQPLLTNGP